MKGGVPRDCGDACLAGFAREEGRVERARDERPEGAAAEGVFAADEDCCFVGDGGQGGGVVVVGLVLRADDGGERGPGGGRECERKNRSLGGK